MAVIGLPDKRLGEIAAAIIQIKQGMTCTESEIKQFCMDLPRYKRPGRSSLPTSPQSHRKNRKAQAPGEILRCAPGGGPEPELTALHIIFSAARTIFVRAAFRIPV